MIGRRVPLAALLMFSMAGLVACGGDDDDSASGGDVKKYCELSDKLSDKFNDFEAETEEQLVAGMKKVLDDNKDLFEDLEDAVPAEIKTEFTKAMDAIRQAAKGDTKALQALEDTSKVDAFDEKNCS